MIVDWPIGVHPRGEYTVAIFHLGHLMNLSIEYEREEDGRWLAEVPQLPGVLAYGASAEEAMSKAQVLALRVIAERLEDQGSTSGRADKSTSTPVAYFDRNKQIAHAFDGLSRSSALLRIAIMRSRGLFTDEEFGRFSDETRRDVAHILEGPPQQRAAKADERGS